MLAWADAVIKTEPSRDERSLSRVCDVVICCRDATDRTRAAIQSVIDQADCIPFLHVVNLQNAAAILDEFQRCSNFQTWDMRDCTSAWSALHQLLPRLRTPFVAVQDPATISLPNRLAWGLSRLESSGGEFYASSLDADGRFLASDIPDNTAYKRSIQSQTLIMRRATLIDMGGFADRPDADVDLLFRAAKEQRTFVVDEVTTVRSKIAIDPPTVGRAPDYPIERTLRQHVPGFEMQRSACDVVLPFRDDFEYVRSAMQSLLAQQEADIVIHLIDDASIENAASVLEEWEHQPNVRVYRNRKNIGPFASFNNVSEFFETEYAAVQDADDLSEPDRIFDSCNTLRLAGADLFGGATILFGNESIQERLATEIAHSESSGECRRIRSSVYPGRESDHCFLLNPTLVIRTETFRRLGGYADFGERLRNRTGIDTEFQLRALYAGCSFAISRKPVVRYRCHHSSATQHAATGMGTAPNREATAERMRRLDIFRRTAFDPRIFGALHAYRGVTERL